MDNVNVEAVEQTAAGAKRDPSVMVQTVAFDGERQTSPGAPQFRTEIPLPGEMVVFEADYPPPMGGTGSAPNRLAYCFWGGLACYAMTYAQGTAREGVKLRALRARVETQLDMSRAVGASDHPPVERIDWYLDVDADATLDTLEAIKQTADFRCPGAWCIRNPRGKEAINDGTAARKHALAAPEYSGASRARGADGDVVLSLEAGRSLGQRRGSRISSAFVVSLPLRRLDEVLTKGLVES
jgi:hypothetical protein